MLFTFESCSCVWYLFLLFFFLRTVTPRVFDFTNWYNCQKYLGPDMDLAIFYFVK